MQSVVFFLQKREQLRVEGGVVSVNLEDRRLRWLGEVVSESEGHVLLKLA